MNKVAIAAGVLVLLVNALILVSVAYNRSGEPLYTLQLTERELAYYPSYRYGRENSGVQLKLDWQVVPENLRFDYYYGYRARPVWLDEAKLSELGVDVVGLKHSTKPRHARLLDRHINVYLVLEYDGEAYRTVLQRAESAVEEARANLQHAGEDEQRQRQLKSIERQAGLWQNSYSRLFVVDAGLDRQALAQRYRDRSQTLVMAGVISVYWSGNQLQGYVNRLAIDRVHVPLPLADFFRGLPAPSYRYAADPERAQPRYQVELKIGKRLQPWLITAERLSNPN
ncbi:DUF4824 family protein [Halioxenophilus sp. WMMB6]|uniref:DUF4824 family protein n=1 Tax=Halioxenophilus sp. WMMB6 TaxID=3073815 RepID=UPI00295E277E|nr:DUF4824 family protein [Halioxenophilus sp. WMMB6]